MTKRLTQKIDALKPYSLTNLTNSKVRSNVESNFREYLLKKNLLLNTWPIKPPSISKILSGMWMTFTPSVILETFMSILNRPQWRTDPTQPRRPNRFHRNHHQPSMFRDSGVINKHISLLLSGWWFKCDIIQINTCWSDLKINLIIPLSRYVLLVIVLLEVSLRFAVKPFFLYYILVLIIMLFHVT